MGNHIYETLLEPVLVCTVLHATCEQQVGGEQLQLNVMPAFEIRLWRVYNNPRSGRICMENSLTPPRNAHTRSFPGLCKGKKVNIILFCEHFIYGELQEIILLMPLNSVWGYIPRCFLQNGAFYSFLRIQKGLIYRIKDPCLQRFLFSQHQLSCWNAGGIIFRAAASWAAQVDPSVSTILRQRRLRNLNQYLAIPHFRADTLGVMSKSKFYLQWMAL